MNGVVNQSVFHRLSFFHVCMPGLPPCHGLDLFEGVIQYDLALILKELSKTRNWNCSLYDHLNTAVKTFKFSSTASVDKPRVLSKGVIVGSFSCIKGVCPV